MWLCSVKSVHLEVLTIIHFELIHILCFLDTVLENVLKRNVLYVNELLQFCKTEKRPNDWFGTVCHVHKLCSDVSFRGPEAEHRAISFEQKRDQMIDLELCVMFTSCAVMYPSEGQRLSMELFLLNRTLSGTLGFVVCCWTSDGSLHSLKPVEVDAVSFYCMSWMPSSQGLCYCVAAQKLCRISHTVRRRTCGRWVASCIRWPPSSLPSSPTTCWPWSRRSAPCGWSISRNCCTLLCTLLYLFFWTFSLSLSHSVLLSHSLSLPLVLSLPPPLTFHLNIFVLMWMHW